MQLLAATQLSGGEAAALGLIILVASVIRGYAGFGFSAIVVAAGALFLPIREMVPLVLLLEIAASAQMLPQIRRQVHWKLLACILAGGVLFIPLGQAVLRWLPLEPMRLVAAVLLLTASSLLAAGKSLPVGNAPGGWLFVGVVSGFMNGLLAMGGMWAVILLLNTGIQAATLRASLVALFFVTDCYATAVGAIQGLFSAPVLARFVFALPLLFVGVWAGARRFDAAAAAYKKVALCLLFFLGGALLLRAVVALWQRPLSFML